MNKNLRLPVAVLLAGVVFWWWVQKEPEPLDVDVEHTVEPEKKSAYKKASESRVRAQPSQSRATAPPVAAGPAPKQRRDALEEYLHWSQFPPLSRPLRSDQKHVINAHMPITYLKPARHQERKSGVVDATPLWVHYKGALQHIFPGQIQHTDLRVLASRDDKNPALVLRNVRAQASIFDRAKGKRVAMLTAAYNDNGEAGDEIAGDNVWSNTYMPSQYVEPDGYGEVTMTAAFEVQMMTADGEIKWDPRWAVFSFNCYRTSPLTLTGVFRETIEDGSLVIYAGIRVKEPGWYKLRALLFDKNDQPLVKSRFDDNLTAGDSEVPFRFHGRLLTQHGLGGPYILARLDGYLFEPGIPPPRKEVRSLINGFTTRAFMVDEFSDKEWDGPSKQRRLKMLRELKKRGMPL